MWPREKKWHPSTGKQARTVENVTPALGPERFSNRGMVYGWAGLEWEVGRPSAHWQRSGLDYRRKIAGRFALLGSAKNM